MLVAVVTTVTTAKVIGPLAPFLGGFTLMLLILSLVTKEALQYAGEAQWAGFHRVLNMVSIPLAVAVVFVLIQHFMAVW